MVSNTSSPAISGDPAELESPFLDVEVPAEYSRVRVDRAAFELWNRLRPGEPHTRAEIQRWLKAGNVYLDGKGVKGSQKVRAGQLLRIVPVPPPLSRAQPDDSVRFELIYSDKHLVVIEKPAGLVVHPGAGHPDKTLVNGLLALGGFEALLADDSEEAFIRPGIVQRLDKETSGVMVVAKTPQAREALKAQLASHSMRRSYLAITRGVPEPGFIETLHGRHPTARRRFSCRVKEGKRAATHVSVERELAEGAAALVRCRLETGRTHQIRVHLTEVAQAPLLADKLYGGPGKQGLLQAWSRRLGRQALHAQELGFLHPISAEELHFERPLPPDMQACLEGLSRSAPPTPESS